MQNYIWQERSVQAMAKGAKGAKVLYSAVPQWNYWGREENVQNMYVQSKQGWELT